MKSLNLNKIYVSCLTVVDEAVWQNRPCSFITFRWGQLVRLTEPSL